MLKLTLSIHSLWKLLRERKTRTVVTPLQRRDEWHFSRNAFILTFSFRKLPPPPTHAYTQHNSCVRPGMVFFKFLEWIPSNALTSDDLDTQRARVQILLFVAVLFIYRRTFYTCSWSYTNFHYDIFARFFIENCPKLRVCIPNFGQTLICYFRSKLRVRSVTSDNNICFKKYYKHSWSNINNFGDLIWIFEAVKLKIVRKTSKWLRFLKVLANHSYELMKGGDIWRSTRY